MESYYGALVGLFFTLPYAVSGLYTGSLTRRGNRKWMLMGVIGVMSLLQIGTGALNSFAALAAFRFLHGAISSSVNPMCFSLVSDYFPPDKRTTANSILSSANFVGIALSSMTILLIKQVGWRASYMAMGAMGLLGSTLLFLLKNPVRGQYDLTLSNVKADKITPDVLSQKKEEESVVKPKGFKAFLAQIKEMTDNPVCKNIFAAGFIRTFGSSIVTAYAPVFFQRVFPAFKSKYALLNAIALISCGISSSLLGGIISDKYEKKSYMTKARIIMLGNALSIPLVAFACFTQSFYLAMIAFALKIFVSGSYYAPAITMM
jgi:MFS family permease